MVDCLSKSSCGHGFLHIQCTHQEFVTFIIIIAGMLSLGTLLNWYWIIILSPTLPWAHICTLSQCIAGIHTKITEVWNIIWQFMTKIHSQCCDAISATCTFFCIFFFDNVQYQKSLSAVTLWLLQTVHERESSHQICSWSHSLYFDFSYMKWRRNIRIRLTR